jgi:hypothetical protein
VSDGAAQADEHGLHDVTAAMDERPRNRTVSLKVVSSAEAAPVESDPFAGIEV